MTLKKRRVIFTAPIPPNGVVPPFVSGFGGSAKTNRKMEIRIFFKDSNKDDVLSCERKRTYIKQTKH